MTTASEARSAPPATGTLPAPVSPEAMTGPTQVLAALDEKGIVPTLLVNNAGFGVHGLVSTVRPEDFAAAAGGATFDAILVTSLFTHLPEIKDGYLVMPDRPGWGTEPNEEGLRAHPPKRVGGLLNYGQKAQQ